MTVGDYYYYMSYKKQLDIFYNKNIYILTITQKCKISDEIKILNKILKL